MVAVTLQGRVGRLPEDLHELNRRDQREMPPELVQLLQALLHAVLDDLDDPDHAFAPRAQFTCCLLLYAYADCSRADTPLRRVAASIADERHRMPAIEARSLGEIQLPR